MKKTAVKIRINSQQDEIRAAKEGSCGLRVIRPKEGARQIELEWKREQEKKAGRDRTINRG